MITKCMIEIKCNICGIKDTIEVSMIDMSTIDIDEFNDMLNELEWVKGTELNYHVCPECNIDDFVI